ncbi:hypothetical protein IB279_20165 [Ensifer sp. ENS06]|uniref:hypothetical protein n=1 Tax=Ensifer sp. ENS06 TaxID=2769276 RepID=UPI001780D5CC|nr:hypothetical protein [Ensifer sp. ENS06]MBD9625253.1 hypothetical protein [Ensifer sp. ENS06]
MGPLVDEYKRKFALGDQPQAANINIDLVKGIVAQLSMPSYHSSQEVMQTPIRERIEMLSPAITARQEMKNPTPDVAASLGGAIEIPALTFAKAFERFKIIAANNVRIPRLPCYG